MTNLHAKRTLKDPVEVARIERDKQEYRERMERIRSHQPKLTMQIHVAVVEYKDVGKIEVFAGETQDAMLAQLVTAIQAHCEEQAGYGFTPAEEFIWEVSQSTWSDLKLVQQYEWKSRNWENPMTIRSRTRVPLVKDHIINAE